MNPALVMFTERQRKAKLGPKVQVPKGFKKHHSDPSIVTLCLVTFTAWFHNDSCTFQALTVGGGAKN